MGGWIHGTHMQIWHTVWWCNLSRLSTTFFGEYIGACSLLIANRLLSTYLVLAYIHMGCFGNVLLKSITSTSTQMTQPNIRNNGAMSPQISIHQSNQRLTYQMSEVLMAFHVLIKYNH